MVALSRTRDLLERVIAGKQVSDPRVTDLLPTVRALASLEIGCRPDPAFAAAVGPRLLAEAAALPVRGSDPTPSARGKRPSRAATPGSPASGSPASVSPATGPQAGRGPHPVIIFVGYGWPRLLAGVAASLIAVASIVGVVSRSALPGQALYPVKQVLDTTAAALAGSDLDKGQTMPGQAEATSPTPRSSSTARSRPRATSTARSPRPSTRPPVGRPCCSGRMPSTAGPGR